MNQTQLQSFFERTEPTTQEAEADHAVKSLMASKTAHQLVDGFRSRGGHPLPEIGPIRDNDGREISWRDVYMDEICRRGKALLEELGWAVEMDALYVNLFTDHVETLAQTMDFVHGSPKSYRRVWATVQGWVPAETNQPNMRLLKYLISNIRSNEDNIRRAKKGQSTHGLGPGSEIKYSKTYIRMYQRELDEELERIKTLGLSFSMSDWLCPRCLLFKPEHEDEYIVGGHRCTCEVNSDRKVNRKELPTASTSQGGCISERAADPRPC